MVNTLLKTESEILFNKKAKDILFPYNVELLDSTNEVFEIDLSLWEYESLINLKENLIKRLAYYKKVEDNLTNHYRICTDHKRNEIYKNSSLRTKAFFDEGKFSTGYATHSLFPYRGKFHPQMIKAILNVIGVKEDETVLDPMMGSGTTCVEANLIGINSIGIEISPFCCLMARAKLAGLDLDVKILKNFASSINLIEKLEKKGLDTSKNGERIYHEVLQLAYLDAMGYARRTAKPIENLFHQVFDRYIKTIDSFSNVRDELNLKIATSRIIENDAKRLPLADDIVDGVITSPPYSFAIDYAENDRPQLEYLGYDIDNLKNSMIGLQGKSLKEKLEKYFSDMEAVISEMSRVTKKDKFIVIIIGSNSIQTKGVRLEEEIKRIASLKSLNYICEVLKPIKGLNNTMKDEYILFFKNTK